MQTKSGSLRLILFILASGFAISSCQKTPIEYGQQYIDNGITHIILVDSITPTVTTVYKDSVPTSGGPNLLVGNYNDPYFGKTSSDAYLQLNQPAVTDISNNAQFDSLVLLMKCNGAFNGDTLLPITIAVTQLSQELKLPLNQPLFYNINSFPLNSTPLGTRSFVLRPKTGDSANVRLSDAKGQELFSLIRNKDNIVKDAAAWTNYIKGLNISAVSTNNQFGFRDSVIMRLYYHQNDISLQYLHFDFAFNNPSLCFNHISADRSATPLAVLNPNNTELPSTSSNHIGYIQSAAGLYAKISFPTIRTLLERSDFVKIIRADLIVKPIQNSYNGLYPLPAQIYAAQTDGGNELGATLVGTGTTGSTGTQTGNLFIDALNGTGTNYTYDVTGYLTQEINIALINKDGLLLLPDASTRYTSMNRLVIGDNQNRDNKLLLNVYYVSVIK